MAVASSQPVKVLVVEDEQADIALIERAFSRSRIDHDVAYSADGEEAIRYVSEVAAERLPDLILLDLKLPRKSGREVLVELKADARWRAIPVAMFSTSGWRQDVEECLQMGASSYIEKPADFAGFVRVIRMIDDFWAGDAGLPRHLQVGSQ